MRFRHALESEKRKIIIYTDTDADGHAAGANLAVALERMGKNVTLRPVDRDNVVFDDKDAAYVLSDIAISDKIIEDAKRTGVRVYYVDHHPPREGWSAIVREHLNSKVLEPEGNDWYHWNTSALVYLAFRDLLHDRSWLTAAGMHGDHADKGFSHKIFIRAHRAANAVATALELAEHFPKEISDQEMGELAISARRPEDILNHPKLDPLYRRYDEEVNRFISDPRKYAAIWDENKKIFVLRLESNIRKIKSPVSSILGDRYKDWVVIVCQPWEGKIDCSLRAVNWKEKNVDMGEWAREFAEQSNGRGGGHPIAAGLKFPEEHWDDFVRWVKEKIGKM